MSQDAWGKWGSDDERGALNYIGAEQVRHATTLVRTGAVLRLAQLLSPKTPVHADLSARNPGLIYRHVAGYDEAAINALTAAGGACAAEQ